jgi:acetate kinase
MKVLVVNAGSSSIKYQLYQMPEALVLAKGMVECIGEIGACLSMTYNGKKFEAKQEIADHRQGVELILATLARKDMGIIDRMEDIDAVGHRVVHGGEEFTGSVLIDDDVIASIEKFSDLAPLHNPPNLVGIRAAQKALPNAKQVACFDTAFHASIPPVAYMYTLPYEIYEKFRIRRYGFHGTSHRYVAVRAAEMLGKDLSECNLITCHLGNGCSITAIKNGKSIDTSMGLTPLEGLMMGTRTGDFDPAILFYLADQGYRREALKTLCNKKSGLLGVSGKSNDMRTLIDIADQGDERSQLAIDIFCYRIKKYIGSYVAALGTLDAVVFTGGIGENNAQIRKKVAGDMPQIGIEVSDERNDAIRGEETLISTDDSRVKVFIIPTDEEVVIARDTCKLVG